MATTEYQNQKYYYLIQTNENTTDIVDNIKIAKENNSNIIFINNINEIFAVLKLFKIEEV